MSTDRPTSDTFDSFHAGAGCHPARQTWLLRELEDWFASDLPDGRDRRRIVADALRSATADAHVWLDHRFEPTELVRVDLHLQGPDRDRHSVFSELPSPLALLLICLDQCRVGDDVIVTQELAKAGRVESRATWPFGMDEAEALTRPARVGCAAHSN